MRKNITKYLANKVEPQAEIKQEEAENDDIGNARYKASNVNNEMLLAGTTDNFADSDA